MTDYYSHTPFDVMENAAAKLEEKKAQAHFLRLRVLNKNRIS
jgi:hypothetical protein